MINWNHFLILLLLFTLTLTGNGSSGEGRIFNPITDVCWSCIFPMHLGGANVTPSHKDFITYKIKPFCSCAGTPPKAGVPLAFWEPVALVEVTRTPYKSLVFGGISFEQSDLEKKGAVSAIGQSGQHSFYNVHYYKAPLLGWLEVFPYFTCLEKEAEIDISYITELDPTWNDDNGPW